MWEYVSFQICMNVEMFLFKIKQRSIHTNPFNPLKLMTSIYFLTSLNAAYVKVDCRTRSMEIRYVCLCNKRNKVIVRVRLYYKWISAAWTLLDRTANKISRENKFWHGWNCLKPAICKNVFWGNLKIRGEIGAWKTCKLCEFLSRWICKTMIANRVRNSPTKRSSRCVSKFCVTMDMYLPKAKYAESSVREKNWTCFRKLHRIKMFELRELNFSTEDK